MGDGGEDAFQGSWTNGIAHLGPVRWPVIRKYWRRSFPRYVRENLDTESAMHSLRQKVADGQAII